MRPIRARSSPLHPMMLTLLLASCGPSGQIDPTAAIVPHIDAVLSEPTHAARKAAIRRQLAPICPTPLSNDELEQAARFVEGNRAKGVVWIAGRLLKFHRETKICRGEPSASSH